MIRGKDIEDEDDYSELEDPRLSGMKDFEIVSKRKRRRHSAGASGLRILLSANTTNDVAANGTTIGTFAVSGSSDVFTFSFLTNPSSLFSLLGPVLQVNGSPLTPGMDIIAIKADNGAGTVLLQSFIIVVSHVVSGYVPTYELLGF